MKITVLSQQSILDIAIQAAGSVEAAFLLAVTNDISLTDELTAGQELIAVGATAKAIADYYTNGQLKPATGVTEPFWNNVWDNTFDDTFGRNYRIFDYTFDSTFE